MLQIIKNNLESMIRIEKKEYDKEINIGEEWINLRDEMDPNLSVKDYLM